MVSSGIGSTTVKGGLVVEVVDVDVPISTPFPVAMVYLELVLGAGTMAGGNGLPTPPTKPLLWIQMGTIRSFPTQLISMPPPGMLAPVYSDKQLDP